MTKNRTILIATGASGGHMFPALSVAEELRYRGTTCVFVVGGGKFTHLVTDAGFEMFQLPASSINVRNIFRKMLGIINLVRAFFKSLSLIHHLKPSAVFGTGGYATVALVLAAKVSGIPTIIHEQNVLPGRANRFLARFADRTLLTFAESATYLTAPKERLLTTGYPLRVPFQEALNTPKPEKTPRAKKPLTLLVIGGSQGSRLISHTVQEAVTRLPKSLQENLHIHQQTRPEDEAPIVKIYKTIPLHSFVVTPFITNMLGALQQAHVVISRAGTGAVIENSLMARPAIYAPLTLADGHQLKNAQQAEKIGSAIILEEPLFTADNIAVHLKNLLIDVDKRTLMEKNARTLTHKNGTKNVADAVLTMAKNDLFNA